MVFKRAMICSLSSEKGISKDSTADTHKILSRRMGVKKRARGRAIPPPGQALTG